MQLFYYCQDVKMVSAIFYCLCLQGYPQSLMIIYAVQSHLRCKYFRNQIDDDQKTLVLPNNGYSNGYETALHDLKYESTRKRLRYVN